MWGPNETTSSHCTRMLSVVTAHVLWSFTTSLFYMLVAWRMQMLVGCMANANASGCYFIFSLAFYGDGSTDIVEC